MHDNHSLNGLALASNSDTACGCGGHDAGGCSCGHGDAGAQGETHAHTHAHAHESSESPLITTEFAVAGMTCGHCVSSVSEELGTLDGVESVEVDLNAGGVSRVTVASQSNLDLDAVRAAIDEAGYSLAEV